MNLIPPKFDFFTVVQFILHGDQAGLEAYALQIEPGATDDEMLLVNEAHRQITETNQAEVQEFAALSKLDAQDAAQAEKDAAAREAQEEQSTSGYAVSES